MSRPPAVAGQFYPGTAAGLSRAVAELTRDVQEKLPAIAVVSPHAGYVYSGAVAGEVFSSVRIPSRIVVFCPNHTGYGEEAAILSHGSWRMPWGDAPVDADLARRLKEACPLLQEDATAHSHEHSLEVQLPFIHRFRPDFRFVPVALGRLSLADCRVLGEAVAGRHRVGPGTPPARRQLRHVPLRARRGGQEKGPDGDRPGARARPRGAVQDGPLRADHHVRRDPGDRGRCSRPSALARRRPFC